MLGNAVVLVFGLLACQDSTPAVVKLSGIEGPVRSADPQRATAIVVNAAGQPLEGHQIGWLSGDPALLSVNAQGHFICHKEGRVDLTATSGALTATAPVECAVVSELKTDELAAGAMTLGGSGDPPEQAATVSRVETVAEKPRADPPSTAQRLRSTPPVATTRTGVVVDTWRDPDEPCLNLRRAANHSSARITCMEDGTELIIHGKTGDWYSVTMPMSHGDGPKGYAHGKWIREN